MSYLKGRAHAIGPVHLHRASVASWVNINQQLVAGVILRAAAAEMA